MTLKKNQQCSSAPSKGFKEMYRQPKHLLPFIDQPSQIFTFPLPKATEQTKNGKEINPIEKTLYVVAPEDGQNRNHCTMEYL